MDMSHTPRVGTAPDGVLRASTVCELQLLQRNARTEGRSDGDDRVGQAQLDTLGAAGDLVAVPDGGVNPLSEGLALVRGQLAIEGSEVHVRFEQYPKVTATAIPEGHSHTDTYGYKIPQMDELANEQLLLMEIKDKLCDGNGAELARRIGKDPTYVNRLFYPRSKPGAKGIGREIMLACNKAFGLPIGFWDVSYPALDPQVVNLIRARMLLRPEGAELQPVGRIGEKLPITGNAASAEEPHASYGMTPILAWEHQDDLPDGDFVMIPRLDVHLSAGGGREQVEIGLTKDNPQAFRTEWIRQQRLRPNRLAAMRAAGESMEPTIHDGDSLLVDTSQTTVVDGKVYALWYDGGERVKRLFRLPGGGLRIKSDNPQHPTIEVGANHHEHVRIIGRVVHRSGIGGL